MRNTDYVAPVIATQWLLLAAAAGVYVLLCFRAKDKAFLKTFAVSLAAIFLGFVTWDLIETWKSKDEVTWQALFSLLLDFMLEWKMLRAAFLGLLVSFWVAFFFGFSKADSQAQS